MNRALGLVLVTVLAFGLPLAARAQSILIDLNELTGADAPQSGSFVNIAINNAAIDGSVEAAFTATAFLEEQAAAEAGATATYSAQSAVEGSLGEIATTVLGAVKYGEITMGMALIMDDADAGAAVALSDYMGPLMNSVAANLVFNQAELNAAVSVRAVNYALDAGDITTIAIGAVSSSAIMTRLGNSLPDITLVAAN